MLTKQEAGKRWCPFARQSATDTATYNRADNGTGAHSCRCITDSCAVWVWVDLLEPENPQSRRGRCGMIPTQERTNG